MTTISSHVLDSVVGDHGRGIRIQCFRLGDAGRALVFDVTADGQGRIAETVAAADDGDSYELLFHTADYFAARTDMPVARQIMDEVIVRFRIPAGEERIHIPLVLSPHSYTIWWSA